MAYTDKQSSSQLQTKSDSVKTEEQQLVRPPIKISIKRSSACLDHGPLTLVKTEDPPPHPTIAEFNWRGNAVGRKAKELFEAIDHSYPNTFQRVQIRVTLFWLNNLKALHVAIARFLGSNVDTLLEEEISGFHQDFRDLETLGFDLSWAHQRLDMVEKLKFGKEPLHQHLMALQQSVGPLKERADEMLSQMMKAHDMYIKALLEHDEDATKALNQTAQEMLQKYGDNYHQILHDRLGFGMLPGYKQN